MDEHVPPPSGPAVAVPAVPPPAAQPERGRFGGLLRAFGRERAPQPDVERGQAPAANAA